MITDAMFLRPGDDVSAHGVVSSVEPFHHPACRRISCGGLCTVNPRVRVRFHGDDDERIFTAFTELKIHRPGGITEPEYRPDLLER
jgi:hypothetical protein